MWFRWEIRRETKDSNSPITCAHLYFCFENDAYYDETSSTEYLRMGTTYSNDEGKWVTKVGYSMRERESDSRFYSDQSDLCIIGEFDTLEEAQEVIRTKASDFFMKVSILSFDA